ncbi:MAG: V-type ATP synthase subunit F [Clostridiales bacterium]|nr:V-type ATP synthase subunit F [Clostridiales bacterium]
MKSFCLCKKYETLISLRLAGIAGKEIHSKEELIDELNGLLKDPEYGLIIISEDILNMAKDEIMEIKLKDKNNLIVNIPEPSGFKEKNFIVKYIRESIGIKV